MEKFRKTLITILLAVDNWRIFKKMGREGWEGIIPIYNKFILFEELYGNGWRILLLLIPIYNIYIIFKFAIDLAHSFHKSSGFGIGMILITPIFKTILAFDDSLFRDGSEANNNKDFIDDATEFVENKIHGTASNQNVADKLKELKRLYDDGILTEEEYEKKRKDLVDKI